jgi:hypothetical protein
MLRSVLDSKEIVMTLRHAKLIVLACIVAGAAVSTAIAQESLRLQFEITVDGSVVGKPELRLEPGGQGSIAFGEKSQAVVTLTPTVRGDDIDIPFDITDGDKRLSPTLRISKTVPGSVEWKSPAHAQKTVRLAVSWVR